MATLSREFRRELERTVIKARRVAEDGARKAIESLAVHNDKPWAASSEEQKRLRVRLRAHGRQLGDREGAKRDTQTIDHLVQECAYEHWHRMLFARFLAENDLLIEPESGVPISLDECRELAREGGADWLAVASDFGVRMLPQIFRKGDPVLEITLPPETRQELEGLLKALSSEAFAADDSLGWVYQFWQTEQKEQVNKSGVKIGADELAAVTQLFTEDYMVLFLLHNTLGAWWAGKFLAAKPEIAAHAKDEDELRAACSVGGYEWTYLRFVREGENGPWRPAAGTFDGWPRAARDLRVLDPCMGSGHFLVFALPILVAFRMQEESLSREQAVDAVLRDNLFGLEIDNRCTQIAAFNLALTAWRMAGYRPLPALNLACSGLAPQGTKAQWLELADSAAVKGGMPAKRNLFHTEQSLLSSSLANSLESLYELFARAPILGSLIDPRRLSKDLYQSGYEALAPLLSDVFQAERDDETRERAVAAAGMAKAADLLARTYTLTITNVPYLARGKQHEVLKRFSAGYADHAKTDLATVFVQRCFDFTSPQGSVAAVSPQNWLFLPSYATLRRRLLLGQTLHCQGRLGPGAFETISGEVVNVALTLWGMHVSPSNHVAVGYDATVGEGPAGKAALLRNASATEVPQASLLKNPDARITLETLASQTLLSAYAVAPQGIKTGDDPRFRRNWWELPQFSNYWRPYRGTSEKTQLFDGLHFAIDWNNEGKDFARLQGLAGWGQPGIIVKLMGTFLVSLHTGELFDSNVTAIVPTDACILPAIWAYCTSDEFPSDIKALEDGIKVNNATVAKVPFDLKRWTSVAREAFGGKLPVPASQDPTQWLFNGHPNGSEQPLQVAVARLLGYRWPRQTGSSFMDCPALGPDGLEKHAGPVGIVALNAVKGEAAAADRLRALLADAYGDDWSAAKLNELLAQVGYGGESLEEWLRDGFFEQHCDLFHNRPFIWHVWDGLRDGFHALVNYHKLAAPNGAGRQTLEKLIYSYLGDWIDRQRADQRSGVEGADGRVAAATHLKNEIEMIFKGEPPYDIFVRWKPLHEQPIGWEPDINDGVRMNIRPFMSAKVLNGRGKSACILRFTPKIKWEKDRGKEPHRSKEDFPWFWSWDGATPDFTGAREFDANRWNDLHYTREHKQEARDHHKQGEKKTGATK